MQNNSITSSKPRYELLDGLRGVAALMVILYHFGEGFATSPVDQQINHGYLAVDFFFALSGFVLGYAYDDRWKNGMTSANFMLRRVIRLQPMVLIAVILGVIAFVIQGCEKWDGTGVSTTAIILSLLLGFFMIPSLPGSLPEIRGNGEMFPLNGPNWSLFFEYIGSILYAVFLHRLSKKALKGVVIFNGACLAALALLNASGTFHIGMGWSFGADGTWGILGFIGGFFRMAFSFSIGLYLSRNFTPLKVRGAFWICTLIIIAVLSVPYVTTNGEISILNACYDLLCTLLIFPFVVYLGASGFTSDATSGRICEFLGNISYPVYIIHYPAMYLFYSYVWKNGYSFSQVWYLCPIIFVAVILLAWFFMRFYDTPVRRYLTTKLLTRRPI
ncbi:MAG: acyltransferase [Paramuribaculum sp.]|nr:acyltransferase [Paramuribaculum sp.]